MSIAALLHRLVSVRRPSLATMLILVMASAIHASPVAAQQEITATVATNVLDGDENGSGDAAGDPAGVPALGSVAVNAVTDVGTRRFHMEWNLAGVVGPVPGAQIQLTTDPGGGSFSLDTLFFAGSATGNGTIEFGDFQTAATQIGSVTMPQTTTGLFSFDVTDELNAALAGGFSFFVVQGRAGNEATLQAGTTFDRGSQIFTTCTSCKTPTADMPQLLIAPPPPPGTRAQFAATKDFTDDNPGDVTVRLDCFTGLPLEQEIVINEGDGDPAVVFVVENFDTGELDCNLSEDALPGYDTSYSASGDSSVSHDTESCAFTNVSTGDENACLITNTPAPVDIEIEKIWVIEGPSDDVDTEYQLTLYCDAFIIDADECENGNPAVSAPSGSGNDPYCKRFYGDGSQTFVGEVIPEYPQSHCWVDEVVYDSAVEINNDCGNLVASAGEGDSCVIVNTVFFEGIPALNQYGVALLALVMLGVGLVGFRRFA